MLEAVAKQSITPLFLEVNLVSQLLWKYFFVFLIYLRSTVNNQRSAQWIHSASSAVLNIYNYTYTYTQLHMKIILQAFHY